MGRPALAILAGVLTLVAAGCGNTPRTLKTMAAHESVHVSASAMGPVTTSPTRAAAPLAAPPLAPTGATWHGRLGPQSPNPLVPGSTFISSLTHPLVTVLVTNSFLSPETVTFDLVITDGPPPPGYAGTPASSTSTTTPGPYPGWTDVVWDRAVAEPNAQDTVEVPSGESATISLDWPDTANTGKGAPYGNYWGVVELSGYWLTGTLKDGGLVEAGNPPSATPATGRTDLWTPLVLEAA